MSLFLNCDSNPLNLPRGKDFYIKKQIRQRDSLGMLRLVALIEPPDGISDTLSCQAEKQAIEQLHVNLHELNRHRFNRHLRVIYGLTPRP